MKIKNEYKYFYIYKIVNHINGKIYIGQRASNKSCEDDTYFGSGISLNKAIKKYGKSNFTKVLIEYVEKNKLNEREIYWISYYGSTNKHVGYNITKGGDSGQDILGDKNPMWGKFGELNPFYGKRHPQHILDAIAEKNRNRKKVVCPFCGKEMDCGSAKAYHFENCPENPNQTDEGKLLYKERKDVFLRAKKNLPMVECPYCKYKAIKTSNMLRYHFENCEHNPALSDQAKERIEKRKETIIRRSHKAKLKNKGKELQICPYCGKESIDALNMKKYHFDNCNLNPNKVKTVFKCIYCGIETTNKTNLIRFHNDNCKSKPN